MPWTNKQKQLAVRACRAAGISEEQRVDMILRSFKHAEYNGDITSTSPKLTNHDYEAFMAIVEGYAGGEVLHFTRGFWQAAAADSLARMRFRVQSIASILEANGKLHADGVGLAGWIEKRVSAGATRRLEELDYHGLAALILGLEAYARQSGIAIEAGRFPSPRKNKNPRCVQPPMEGGMGQRYFKMPIRQRQVSRVEKRVSQNGSRSRVRLPASCPQG